MIVMSRRRCADAGAKLADEAELGVRLDVIAQVHDELLQRGGVHPAGAEIRLFEPLVNARDGQRAQGWQCGLETEQREDRRAAPDKQLQPVRERGARVVQVDLVPLGRTR